MGGYGAAYLGWQIRVSEDGVSITAWCKVQCQVHQVELNGE